MKKSILIFTLAAVAIGGSLGYLTYDAQKQVRDPKSWEAYSSGDQRFDVKFPSKPEESSKEMDVANTTIQFQELSSEADNAQYAVSYVDFPGMWKWIGDNKLLNKTFDNYIDAQQEVEEVLQKELSSHGGLPALMYKYKQAGKEVQGKFVIAGNTLYRITVTYPLAAAQKIQPESFLDSFQIKS